MNLTLECIRLAEKYVLKDNTKSEVAEIFEGLSGLYTNNGEQEALPFMGVSFEVPKITTVATKKKTKVGDAVPVKVKRKTRSDKGKPKSKRRKYMNWIICEYCDKRFRPNHKTARFCGMSCASKYGWKKTPDRDFRNRHTGPIIPKPSTDVFNPINRKDAANEV